MVSFPLDIRNEQLRIFSCCFDPSKVARVGEIVRHSLACDVDDSARRGNHDVFVYGAPGLTK